MNNRINEFKHHLAAVFDDNLHTKQGHNIADIRTDLFVRLFQRAHKVERLIQKFNKS